MGREGGPGPGDSKQYSPGEIADLEISRAQSDAATDKRREALRADWDKDTAEIVAETRETEGDAAADTLQQRREAIRDRRVEETVQQWATNEMKADFRKRDADKERYKLEPEKAAEVLKAIDRLWDDIDQALNYRPEHKGESIIDKAWADTMMKILNELRDQVKFEGSFPSRMFDAIYKEGGRQGKWLEPNWKRKVEAFTGILVSECGESYTESPQEERQRRAAGDRARSEYKAGEIRERVDEM